MIKNIAVCLLITAWMTSCGSKPNGNTNNPAIKAQEAQEKSLLDELKPFIEDEFADSYPQFLAAEILVPPNTPTYVIRDRLEKNIKEIDDLEQCVKNSQTANPDLYKIGKKAEGTKKILELRKATRKKYELILGIHKST